LGTVAAGLFGASGLSVSKHYGSPLRYEETVSLNSTANYIEDYRGTDYPSLIKCARSNIAAVNNGRFPKLSALEANFGKVAEIVGSQKENDPFITEPLVRSLTSDVRKIASEEGNNRGYLALAVIGGALGAIMGFLTLVRARSDED
jgi:hypothetical protein